MYGVSPDRVIGELECWQQGSRRREGRVVALGRGGRMLPDDKAGMPGCMAAIGGICRQNDCLSDLVVDRARI